MSSSVRRENPGESCRSKVGTWALRGALGTTTAALLLIAAQIPYTQESKNFTAAPTSAPKPEATPASVTNLLPLEVLLAENLRPGNIFRNSVIDVRYPSYGIGYDSYLEQCSTYGGPEAYATVNMPLVNVRSTAYENSPVVGQLHKGQTFAFRLRLIMTQFRTGAGKVLDLIEGGKRLYTAAAITGGTELIKNNLGTDCVAVGQSSDAFK